MSEWPLYHVHVYSSCVPTSVKFEYNSNRIQEIHFAFQLYMYMYTISIINLINIKYLNRNFKMMHVGTTIDNIDPCEFGILVDKKVNRLEIKLIWHSYFCLQLHISCHNHTITCVGGDKDNTRHLIVCYIVTKFYLRK